MPVEWSAIGACLLPNTGALIEGLLMRRYVDPGWWDTLKKPSWCPKKEVFGRVYGPIWTGLYTGMGYASYLVWRDGGGFEGPARIPLALYGSQLLLNWSWGPVFFGAHNIPLSLVNISALWVNVAACGWAFYGVNPTAGYLFVPYVLWLTLATALNYQIYKLNCTGKDSKE